MDSSDSLKLDENLARFLAAYDQGLDGGTASAQTLHVPFAPGPAARPVTPLNPDAPHEGSIGELFPDSGRHPVPAPRAPVGVPPPLGGSHRIARFELRRQLGKGGCGIVFLAYDPKLRREVALKVPRPEMLMNADAKRRLKLEALAASEFDHPNLVPVYEWGEVGPLCFIATAYCPGLTLAEWIDRQAFPVPLRQAARLVATLADAVQHAHDRGVLHRDLKPNNVLLQEMKVEANDEPPAGSVPLRGAHYVPRVVDFGLAKLAERGGPSETATRQVLGTPKYMAPEQAQARREDIGPPADVYALGVVLYELIAGRAPYDGASDVEVLRQSVEGKAVPPRHLRPDIPRDLEAICQKAMARFTPDRYRTAIDFADDLRRFLDARPTVARPLAWSGRALRWVRRNDQFVAIIVLAAIALTVSLLGTWNSYRNTVQSRQLRSDRDTVVRDQADRYRADRHREYVRHTADAFRAWRGGNGKAAADELDAARLAATALLDAPDFAHEYIAKLVRDERLLIACPAGPVTALAVSPDGARLASGHADGTVAVWDRATGRALGAARAHDADVTHLGFALGGKLLVTAGPKSGGAPELLGWSVSAAGALAPAEGAHRALGTDVTCLAVAPGGAALFAGDGAGAVFKLNLTDGSRVAVSVGAGDRATALAVAPDTGRVLVGTRAGRVLRYAPELTEERADDYRRGVTALAARPDGGYEVGFADGARSWAPGVFGGWSVERPGAGRVRWLASGPLGFASGAECVRFDLGPAPGANPQTPFARATAGELPDAGAPLAGAFSPDGKVLFTAGADGVIRASGAAHAAKWVAPRGRPVAVAVRHDGSDFAVYDRDRGAAPVYMALVSGADGTRRAVTFEDRTAVVRALGPAPAELLRVRLPDGRAPASAALTADGKTLALGDDAGRLSVWAVGDKNALGTADTGTKRPVAELVLSDDGRCVAARTATGVGLWVPGTLEPLATIPADERAPFRFLPGGDRLVVGGADGTVRLWNLNGREELALFGHVGRVTGVGASPDGRTLVTGCAGGEVKFWDARTGHELLGVRRHSVPVTVIEFAGNGKLLVTGGGGQIAVWDPR